MKVFGWHFGGMSRLVFNGTLYKKSVRMKGSLLIGLEMGFKVNADYR